MLTILIPTHNRPKELRIALGSLIKIMVPFKVIINCDDKSINENILKEFPRVDITFYKKKFWNWGEVYAFLIQKVQTEYFYFLEDDDKLRTDFEFLNSSSKPDYYFGYYNPHARESTTIVKIRKWFTSLRGITHNELFRKYSRPEELTHFQLGQLVFKTENIKKVPTNNNKYNDWYLFKDNPGTIEYLDKVLYSQGLSHYSIS